MGGGATPPHTDTHTHTQSNVSPLPFDGGRKEESSMAKSNDASKKPKKKWKKLAGHTLDDFETRN